MNSGMLVIPPVSREMGTVHWPSPEPSLEASLKTKSQKNDTRFSWQRNSLVPLAPSCIDTEESGSYY